MIRQEARCCPWQSSWNMVCGRNKKFNAFDLACGFLNNSQKVLAHFRWLWTVVSNDLHWTCFAQSSVRAVLANNALWHFLLAVFFSLCNFLKPLQQRWGSSYTINWVSTTVFSGARIFWDLQGTSRCNKPSQILQIWWPWSDALQLGLLFSRWPQDATHHPPECLICFPCEHCCSHFHSLHPLLLLMSPLSGLVKC